MGWMRSMGMAVVITVLALDGLAAQSGAQAQRLEELARVRAQTEAVLAMRAQELAQELSQVQDPADSLYRAARSLLNSRRYVDAALRFAELRERYPRSTYVGNAYYFQALALYREGGAAEYDEAYVLLEQQLARYSDATTIEDARQLALRLRSQAARRGDAQAAADVARSASAQCDDEDQGLRAMALSALMQMDSDQATPILREVLRERGECSAELRQQALFILAQNMDDETIDVLVDLAVTNPDPDPEVRAAAAFWLAQAGTEEALDALLALLRSAEGDPELQESAMFGVAQHQSPRVAEILQTYARDASASTEMRANAIFWLSQQEGEESDGFMRNLYGSLSDPEMKESVLFAVGQRQSESNRAWLLARARDDNEDMETRKSALFWAGQAGLQTAEVLAIYRSTDDAEMKEQALFVIAQSGELGPEVVDVLMEIARDENDPELREHAVFWLGQSKDPRVPAFLLQLIRDGGGGV